jgi:hypothetical protein
VCESGRGAEDETAIEPSEGRRLGAFRPRRTVDVGASSA